MDVRARADPDPADTRCPYCHDLLAVDAAQVECGGCGTRHHAGCLEELGRCTVLGCAWTTDGRPPPPITTRPTEALRRRVAERMRTLGPAYRAGRDAARAAGEGPPEPPPPEALWETSPHSVPHDPLFIHPDTRARARAADVWLMPCIAVGLLLVFVVWLSLLH